MLPGGSRDARAEGDLPAGGGRTSLIRHAPASGETKTVQVRRSLAEQLLTLEIGDRLAPIATFSERLGVGRGTVQVALDELQQAGVIQLQRRGHLGTFVRELDRTGLCAQAGITGIYGLMPLPYSRRYEGFATGLHACFADSELRLSLGFMRGARERWQALLEGKADFILLSRYAFDLLSAEGSDSSAAVSTPLACAVFPPGSYVSEHVVFLASEQPDGIEDGMRVGVDPSSADQQQLTLAECEGKSVTFHEMSYMVLLERLIQGELEAAIWNVDDRLFAPRLRWVPLSNPRSRAMQARNTAAVLAVRSDRPALVRLLSDLVRPDVVTGVQREVMEARLVPRY